jgi:thiamine kinase-like enzyme
MVLGKSAMQDRRQHQPEVRGFLQKHFLCPHWRFSLPSGTGHETYFAYSNESAYFVKLGVQTARYEALDALGLIPPVLAAGNLEDGSSIIVQSYLEGRTPSRKDYRLHLEQFAAALDRMHHSADLQRVLPAASSDRYNLAGLAALDRLQQRWAYYRVQVPQVADFVDESLAALAGQVQSFTGKGLVASHNDICNANWLITPDGRLYLTDLELMSLDDPALDIGATLWWYYPPELWPRFLEIAGYPNDASFHFRMRVRMALHCLSITLPRQGSFDPFDSATYAEALTDFRAILAGGANPEINDE